MQMPWVIIPIPSRILVLDSHCIMATKVGKNSSDFDLPLTSFAKFCSLMPIIALISKSVSSVN